MHLGNGAITPECVAITLSAASAGLGLCAWSARREARPLSKLGFAAGLGAFVFAAQAVNVPILPGISAHLVGGVLLAWRSAGRAFDMVLMLALWVTGTRAPREHRQHALVPAGW
jgi:ABC-type Co2+ transport system permease subunit